MRQIWTSATAPVLRSSPRSAVYSLDQVSESQFARFAARAGLPGDASRGRPTRSGPFRMAGQGHGRPTGSSASGRARARPSTPCWRSYCVSGGPNCGRGWFTVSTACPANQSSSGTELRGQRRPGRRADRRALLPGDHPGGPGRDDRHHLPRRPDLGRAAVDAPGLRRRRISAGDDPDAGKAALEASYCDPLVREPFIAALALASQLAGHA